MKKSIVFFRLLLSLYLLLTLSNPVVASELEISANQLFFLPQSGQWWKIRANDYYSQGVYLEYLQIEGFYQQIGAGIEINLLHRPSVELWGLVGGEGYQLVSQSNNLLRTGLRLELPLPFLELHWCFDLMVDDQLGNFPRYYLEIKSSTDGLQGNGGFGNLLGSRDGYAFWVGFEI